ncbi:hypothetical protein IU469_22000 [Nocardia puris]|nr:hypothetical protein [Nocardia puris]
MYRVQVTSWPQGSMRQDPHDPDCSYPDRSWRPPNWSPSPQWVGRYGGDTGDAFFWPKTDRWYRSRSSAARLRKLLESYGATAIIQRSAPILWPHDGYEHVGEHLLRERPAS